MTPAHHARSAESLTHVFPPALVSVLRSRSTSCGGCLTDVVDEAIVELLTTIFFAGLETYEGEHNPIQVAFLGRSTFNYVIHAGAGFEGAALYQWKVMPFESPRPFEIRELVKLAVASANAGIFSAVHVLNDGTLAITGLAREGFNADSDPFVKIEASKPGSLTIRSGRNLLVGYERGAILTGGEDLVFSAGPIRRALEATARAAELDDADVPDYLHAIQSIVREMAAHGRGGILIVSCEELPKITEFATYRMMLDSSVTSLLRLARRISGKEHLHSQHGPRPAEPAHRSSEASNGVEPISFRHLLRNAFVTEADRVVEELGALTGIDGAVLLNRELALVAFGVILPVGRPTAVAEAVDTEGLRHRIGDLGSRGTRHRASANYAAEHPGSVVFVASEDGQVSCLFRDPSQHQVLLWRLGPANSHGA